MVCRLMVSMDQSARESIDDPQHHFVSQKLTPRKSGL